MGNPVTDPALLAQLDAPSNLKPVTDPALLARLDGKPATAHDRMQAIEGGILNGASYLATTIPDAAANVWNLGKAALGSPWLMAGKTPPEALQVDSGPSPVGHALTKLLDKSPLTTTQPVRPDDTASRYLAGAASIIPAALAGSGGNIAQAVKTTVRAAPAVAAGQAVAEARPFESDAANNAASIGAQMLIGALVPGGPRKDVPGRDDQNAIIRNAQSEGAVFPPATTNPTAKNRMVETIAGKQNIQQHASVINQQFSNNVSRREIGLPEGGAITDSELAQARKSAAPGYDGVRNIGTVNVPPTYAQKLAAALSKQSGSANLSPSLRDRKLEKIASELAKNKSFDASDAVDTIAVLRDKANEAFRAGNSGTGKAYKGMSNAIEDAIEDHLSYNVNSSQSIPQRIANAQILANYRNSRQTFAKIATVEKARNIATGNVDATKLLAAMKSGKYMSGGLKLVAQAAGQAPLAFKEPTHSAGVNHLGAGAGLVAGGLAARELLPEGGGLAGLAGAAGIQLGRYGARKYAFGPGQSGAIPTVRGPVDPKLIWALSNSAPAR